MKPLDPRLLGHARATRAYLAATVVLGVLHAGLLIGQAVLLEFITSEEIAFSHRRAL